MGRGRGPTTADSYIGSLISLTSKSEIRYEGILYTVDTENSNIALQNVRSFGTEGRKKDGPQIPASDKVYDYIIFRGSDIKDLQVNSSPPPPLQPPPIHQPADPAIISLQSQPQFPPPSSLGSYNGGLQVAGSSAEPSAPPPPYMGMPPSPYRGAVPPLYPPTGLQSWGPPLPPPGSNGLGLPMPMYWHGYYRPPPAEHLQHQPMPPQPPPSLATPPQGQSLQHQLQPLAQQYQQGQQPSPPPQQLPATGPSSSGTSTSASQFQTQPSVSSVSSAPVGSFAASVISSVSTSEPPTVSAVSTTSTPVASSIRTVASAPASGVPIPAASSLALPLQGVSAVITPVAKNPRRIVGNVSQAPQVPSSQAVVDSSKWPISSIAPTESAQPLGDSVTAAKPGLIIAQSQSPPKVEQKPAEPANVEKTSAVLTSSQVAPVQHQASQPLLSLPTAEQNQQSKAQTLSQRGNHGVGQRNRWQGNGYKWIGNHSRRGGGRGTGSGSGVGRGIGLANPTQQFTEDFDFTAMNEKFNKDEVWGALGVEEEEGDYDDGSVEDEAVDSAQTEMSKKFVYKKDDFFDSLSSDSTGGGRGERTKFSEQRKIDTETFGAFPVRSRRGRGGTGGRRGGYRGGSYGSGSGSYGIGRNGSSRGRGVGRALSSNV